jgi:hypothetical protein
MDIVAVGHMPLEMMAYDNKITFKKKVEKGLRKKITCNFNKSSLHRKQLQVSLIF